MTSLLRYLRYAFRALAQNPGFAAAAILSPSTSEISLSLYSGFVSCSL